MRRFLAIMLVVLALSAVGAAGTARADGGPITITPVTPLPGDTVQNRTPLILATVVDSAGTIVPSTVVFRVNGVDVAQFDGVLINATSISYAVPSILPLPLGNNTVAISLSDTAGNTAEYSWGFQVNTTAGAPGGLIPMNLRSLLVDAAVIAGLAAAGFGGYIVYLQRRRRFTFRKYFATHPVKKEYLVLYIPGTAAFLFVLLGLIYVIGTRGLPLLAPEYVVIIGSFIGLTAFAVDARREKRLIRARERAFAQFLFEMADAMRGGIDPAKAVVELAKSTSNILQKPLRIAADGIRMGRPFDAVLTTMVAPMKSALVARYAGLIAEASGVGGETSAVVYRAAKDMDDFLKIEVERGKQLLMPVAVLYIAFGVLMAVLFALLYIAPTLGSINISFFGGNPLASAGSSGSGATVAKLDPSTLKVRFYDLMLIISLGTGAIIGAFTEGKARYGLLHSLGLVAGTAVAFAIMFP